MQRPRIAPRKIRLRSVFVSDVHLGSRDCRARELLKFLESIEVDYPIPGRRHRRLLESAPIVLLAARNTTRCCARFSPWPRKARASSTCPATTTTNIREFCGSVFGNLSIRRRYVHATADGRELLVMHGDEFDSAVKCSRWLAQLRRHRVRNHDARQSRRERCAGALLGLPHWSLATYLKLRLRECRALRRRHSSMPRRRPREPQPRRHRLRPHSPRRACAKSTACSTATTATGSRAARRSSST